MTTLNVDNIKVIQPKSVYHASDKEVFDYYVGLIKKPEKECFENILSIGLRCQTYEEFVETGKIDYRLRGILVMLTMEVAYYKKNKQPVPEYIED